MWCSSNTRQQIEAIESSLQLPETRLVISTINHIPYNRRKAIKCPNLSFNAKKGEAARPPPSQFKRTARCRPPVSGALASHGLTPQYSRRDGA